MSQSRELASGCPGTMGVNPSSKATRQEAEILKELKENNPPWENTRPVRTQGWDKLQTRTSGSGRKPRESQGKTGLGRNTWTEEAWGRCPYFTDHHKRKCSSTFCMSCGLHGELTSHTPLLPAAR